MADSELNPVLRRDVLLGEIRHVLESRRDGAVAAMSRVSARVAMRTADVLRRKQDAANELGAMLETARQMCLYPQRLRKLAFVVTPEHMPVKGIHEVMAHEGRHIFSWMIHARDRGVFVDIGTERSLSSLSEFLGRAKEAGLSLRTSSAVDVYIGLRMHAMRERPEFTREHAEAEIDGSKITGVGANENLYFFGLINAELAREADYARTDSAWWDLGILFAWMHLPDFDVRAYGHPVEHPWHAPLGHDDFGWARFQYRDTIGKFSRTEAGAHDLLLERTATALRSHRGELPLNRIPDDVDEAMVNLPRQSVASPRPGSANPSRSAGNTDPDPATIKQSILLVSADAENQTYTIEDVIDLYGLSGRLTPTQFRTTTRFIRRNNGFPADHLLPQPIQAERKGGKVAPAYWKRDAVHTALLGWLSKLGQSPEF